MIKFIVGFILGAWIGFSLAAMMVVSSRMSRREEEIINDSDDQC